MGNRKKILLADDDIHVRKMLSVVLSPEFEIIHACDGQETLERVDSEQPDLIVLDILMPFKDGRDICRDLKKNPKTKNIKILILSGKDQQLDRVLGLEIGADDYITKPFSPNHLASKIKRMLQKA